MEFSHRSVLLEPAVNALVDPDFGAKGKRGQASVGPLTQAHGVFVDGTFGRGGHSRYLLSRLSPQSTLVVFDKDPEAIAVAHALQMEDSRVKVVHSGFAAMPERLLEMGVEKVDGVMLVLGISSP